MNIARDGVIHLKENGSLFEISFEALERVAEEKKCQRKDTCFAEIVEIDDENEVCGVTCLKNKLYIICKQSTMVLVFDVERFKEDHIKLEREICPGDITASESYNSIFISDQTSRNQCLWKISMLLNDTVRWMQLDERLRTNNIKQKYTEGTPCGLSITSNDELLVVVKTDGFLSVGFHLQTYKCSDLSKLRLISLPSDITAYYAVELSNERFVISHETSNSETPIGIHYFPFCYSTKYVPRSGLESDYIIVVDLYTGKVFPIVSEKTIRLVKILCRPRNIMKSLITQ